jgi:hypothetical protein
MMLPADINERAVFYARIAFYGLIAALLSGRAGWRRFPLLQLRWWWRSLLR